jgi:hypothetical protein
VYGEASSDGYIAFSIKESDENFLIFVLLSLSVTIWILCFFATTISFWLTFESTKAKGFILVNDILNTFGEIAPTEWQYSSSPSVIVMI